MMKKKNMRESILAGVVAFFAMLVTGCASVTYSSPGTLESLSIKGAEGAESGQIVTISTTGYYLLWTIPLVSGDLRWDPEQCDIKGGASFFRDQVGYNELQDVLLKIAENRNSNLAEVYFSDSDDIYAEVSEGGLIAAFFGSSQMCVSAVLIPRKTIAK